MTLTRYKILVVNDSDSTKVLHALLADQYHVLTCNSGEHALQMVEKECPDLILLDMVMPDMDGFEVCRRLKANPHTQGIPVIFVTATCKVKDEARGFKLGAVDYISKPISPSVLLARVKTHLSLANQSNILEQQVRERTEAMEAAQEELRKTMHNLLTIQVTPGVYWLQVPEVGLYVLCGCPGEIVKHLMRKGLISTVQRGGATFESGPNAILLSDILVQNGGFSNLAEFPVLQMLYRQGMILPNHPNNTGIKPLLIGATSQVKAQMEYIHRGNYGLISEEEVLACGVEPELAETLMRIKRKFAFGVIRSPEQFLDTLELKEQPVSIRDGVTLKRVGFNKFRFSYRGESADIDLNLPSGITYEVPYPLGRHSFKHHYFAVLHTGEGDGWDVGRPSMGSIVFYQGRVYLVDASPGILNVLTSLGLDVSEVEGIFHTHGHDDHFAGLPVLIRSDHRIKYYATPLVRASVTKKFAALTSLPEEKFAQFFEICDLKFDVWNNCDGLEVMPIYSPHPVENSIIMLRALDSKGYKTYAHWADLSSLKVLDNMTGDGPNDVSPEFINKVKASYLSYANLKKLDIGAGMIHGVAEDFREDPSDRLVLAHIARELTPEEMEIGSEAFFGTMDILIAGQQDYLRQRAFRFIKNLFPQVATNQIHMLINSPVIYHNAGTIIHRHNIGDQTDHVDMILSGAVAHLNTEEGINNRLPFGSLIGTYQLTGSAAETHATYRAISHCSTIRFPVILFKAFLGNNLLFDHMRAVVDKADFLRKTWLFGEQTTFFRLAHIAQKMELLTVQKDVEITPEQMHELWLVQDGEVQLLSKNGQVIETIGTTGFFGKDAYLTGRPGAWRCVATAVTNLYRLNEEDITEIPIVHWKMLEVHEKRLRRLDSMP